MSRIYLNKRESITQERLKELLDYNPETGIFTRKTNLPRAKVGTMAGHSSGWGYLSIQLDKIKYVSHRLAWLYVYGEWPEYEIDHINGDKRDNRISNLREVTTSGNAQNKIKANKNNQCGYLGVYYFNGRYRSGIKVNGKIKHLGHFDTPQEAHEAYLKAKRILHPTCTI